MALKADLGEKQSWNVTALSSPVACVCWQNILTLAD